MYSVSLSQRRAHSDELRAHSPRAERCSEMAGMRRRCQLTVGVNNMRSSPDLMEHLPEVMKSTPAIGGGASIIAARVRSLPIPYSDACAPPLVLGSLGVEPSGVG
jgi:hypothetical protein